jgi:hypothetical protein
MHGVRHNGVSACPSLRVVKLIYIAYSYVVEKGMYIASKLMNTFFTKQIDSNCDIPQTISSYLF